VGMGPRPPRRNPGDPTQLAREGVPDRRRSANAVGGRSGGRPSPTRSVGCGATPTGDRRGTCRH
jgi:hypothetical protein